MLCRHYIIEGKVQGVGYRHFTFKKAKWLSISGWVKNLPNGKVECLAKGELSLLSKFEKYLRQGPPFSEVFEIQSKEISSFQASYIQGTNKAFEIQG